VAQLGANAHGEVLEAGRVLDCYLGLRLDPPAAEPLRCWSSRRPRCNTRQSRSQTAPCCTSW
jgi:hypothetical protein